jgi:DNA-directed RNA polymerase specialized sigma24 family protein
MITRSRALDRLRSRSTANGRRRARRRSRVSRRRLSPREAERRVARERVHRALATLPAEQVQAMFRYYEKGLRTARDSRRGTARRGPGVKTRFSLSNRTI